MSNIANITVFDGAATPVSHTLVPVYVQREGKKISALWREQSSSLPVEAQVSLLTTLTELGSGVYQTESTVSVPVMESVSGQNSAGYTAAPKVAYIDKMKTTGFHSRRSTVTGRRLARQLMVNLLNGVSTSVAPATSGFLPELYDQLISAT